MYKEKKKTAKNQLKRFYGVIRGIFHDFQPKLDLLYM